VSLSSWEYSLARAYLSSHSADQLPHVGGTLMKHLCGTCELLRQWDRPAEICLAGLCHTMYGTDGYPNPLEDPARRDKLAAIIGREAEALVYFYASCDRGWLYPQFAPAATGTAITFRDRFSGKVFIPSPDGFAAFLELTFANELEIIRGQWPHVPQQNRIQWQTIFERCRNLVSDAAFECFHRTFDLTLRKPAA